MTVFTGPDHSEPGQVVDFVATWPTTAFTVDAVRIEIDTDQTTNSEQIDSVQLRGVPAPDVTGPKVVQTSPQTGHPGPLDHIDLIFSEAIQEDTFTLDDVFGFEGPDGAIDPIAINRIDEQHIFF